MDETVRSSAQITLAKKGTHTRKAASTRARVDALAAPLPTLSTTCRYRPSYTDSSKSVVNSDWNTRCADSTSNIHEPRQPFFSIIPQRASLTSLCGLQSTIQIHRGLDQLIHNRFLPLLTQLRHLSFHSFLLRRGSGRDRLSNGLQPSLTLVVGSGKLVGEERCDFLNLFKAYLSVSRQADRFTGTHLFSERQRGQDSNGIGHFLVPFRG